MSLHAAVLDDTCAAWPEPAPLPRVLAASLPDSAPVPDARHTTPQKRFTAMLAIAVLLHAVLLVIDPGLADTAAPARRLAVQLMTAAEPTLAPDVPAPQPQPRTPPRERVLPANTTPAPAPASPALPASVPAATTDVPADAPIAPPPRVEARVDTNYLDNPRPAYPPMSRRLGEEGTVLLRVEVNAAGEATAVTLEKSCGFPRLDEAARRAVLQWRFLPARRGDTALTSTVLVPVSFALASAR